jgi:hypothetical protein
VEVKQGWLSCWWLTIHNTIRRHGTTCSDGDYGARVEKAKRWIISLPLNIKKRRNEEARDLQSNQIMKREIVVRCFRKRKRERISKSCVCVYE